MNSRVSGFDWDEGNRAKCQKHGVSITQIEALFAHNPRIAPDPKHSVDEDQVNRRGENRYGAAHIRGLYDTDKKPAASYPASDSAVYAR